MALSEYTDEPQPSTAEFIASVESLVWVRRFEYEPRTGFMHATVDRAFYHPYDIVKKIEEWGISADGLFLFTPPSFWADYSQHARYNAQMKAFLHSNWAEVDAAKIQTAA